jgi:hypothetical protein
MRQTVTPLVAISSFPSSSISSVHSEFFSLSAQPGSDKFTVFILYINTLRNKIHMVDVLGVCGIEIYCKENVKYELDFGDSSVYSFFVLLSIRHVASTCW